MNQIYMIYESRPIKFSHFLVPTLHYELLKIYSDEAFLEFYCCKRGLSGDIKFCNNILNGLCSLSSAWHVLVAKLFCLFSPKMPTVTSNSKVVDDRQLCHSTLGSLFVNN